MSENRDSIVSVELDERSIVKWNAEIEHERDRAIADLLKENMFRIRDGFEGPYELVLSLRDGTLAADVTTVCGDRHRELLWPVRSLKRLIKDYFLICDSYFRALKGASVGHIETIDMARRGLHNEGAEVLKEIIARHVETDDATARRLFTLVCVLHLRS